MKLKRLLWLVIIIALYFALVGYDYNYQLAQKIAEQKCKRSLYFPLEEYRACICDFDCYTAPTGNLHGGSDYAVPIGTKVLAPEKGRVAKAVESYGNTYPDIYSYGNVVYINHVINDVPVQTRLAHLSSISVKPGDYVRRGDVVGYSGNSGFSSGPHIHVEVRIMSVGIDGTPVNPYPLLWASSPPVISAKKASRRESQKEIVKLCKDIDKLFKGFPPCLREIEDILSRVGKADIIHCSIDNNDRGVDCQPVIYFQFNHYVSDYELAANIEISPPPIAGQIISMGQDNQLNLIGINGFMLSAKQDYTLKVKETENIESYEISFQTGSWPHPPRPNLGNYHLIQEKPVHLGNNEYDGPINRPLHLGSQGLSYETSFDLGTLPIMAKLKLIVQGAQLNDPIYLNEQTVGRLTNNLTNNGKRQAFTIPLQALRIGKNKLRIESLKRADDNYDDFEFWQVEIYY